MKLNNKIICILISIATILTVVLPTYTSKVYAASTFEEDLENFKKAVTDISSANLEWEYGDYGGKMTIPINKDDYPNIAWDRIEVVSSDITGEGYKIFLTVWDKNKEQTTDTLERVQIQPYVNYNGERYPCVVTDIRKNDGSIEFTIGLEAIYDEDGQLDSDAMNSKYGDISSATEGVTLGTSEVLDKPKLYDTVDDRPAMESFESMIAEMLTGLSNGINAIVAGVLGRRVTIDDLVFDNYPDTNISYFEKENNSIGHSELIWGDANGNGGLHDTINSWYSLFEKIAIIVYMVLLVYMGIRIMLSSTGEGTAKYKELFVYWVIGVIILFFYPYVMKYAIKLNMAFVNTVERSVSTILNGQKMPTPAKLNNAVISEASNNIENLDISQNPFEEGAKDYMSVIADNAASTKRAAIALAYLIMTWQLITLIIHYYKRLLMTGFLIVIFPIVMMFYVIDKVGDGKSQSFNKWNKEFLLNVFIQSFHAIIYVFVCGTVYAAGISSETYDFVLVIVGVTFMFSGEEIIKKIFSQESKSITRPLGETMAKAILATKAVTSVASAVTKPIIGKDSIYNKVRTAYNQVKTSNTKQGLFSSMASTVSASRERPLEMPGTQEAMANISSSGMSSEEQNRAMSETRRTAGAVSALNNAEGHSSRELASYYSTIQGELNNNPGNAVLKDLNIDKDTLKRLGNLGVQTASMVAAGNSVVDIERKVKAELEVILGDLEDPKNKKLASVFLANMSVNGFNRGLSRDKTMEEIEQIERAANSFNFYSEDDEETEEEKDSRETLRRQILAHSSYYVDRAVQELESRAATDDEIDSEDDLATAIATYQNRDTGVFTAEEQLKAINLLKERSSSGSALDQKMISQLEDEEEEMDIDTARNTLASKIAAAEDSSSDLKAEAEAVIQEYEGSGHHDDEISISEVVSSMSNDEERSALVSRVDGAREKTNQLETMFTKRIGKHMIEEEGIDIDGDYDGTLFFEGQSLRDIKYDKVRAMSNAVKGITGMPMDNSGQELSSQFLKELRARKK